jgi:hypothetical protein
MIRYVVYSCSASLAIDPDAALLVNVGSCAWEAHFTGRLWMKSFNSTLDVSEAGGHRLMLSAPCECYFSLRTRISCWLETRPCVARQLERRELSFPEPPNAVSLQCELPAWTSEQKHFMYNQRHGKIVGQSEKETFSLHVQSWNPTLAKQVDSGRVGR